MAKKKATKRRRTIGDDPLDSLIPDSRSRVKATTKASRRGLAPAGTTERKPKPKKTPSKVRYTVHLPTELIEEARNAVVALYGTGNLTLATLTEDALRRELARLKKKHNGGRDFPQRTAEPRIGRPIR